MKHEVFTTFSKVSTSRNQPKCNHSIYVAMWLVVICDYIWEYLQAQYQLSTILVIFTTMMQLLKNFILLVTSNLHLFSSINRLVCPISCNSHQINYILKVFYNDIRVYFNVYTKIIHYIICIHMYIVHIMNLKINIWTLNFFIQIWKLLFQLFKTLFEFEIFDLNMIFSISIQKDLFDLKFDFEF
jgi:hypothetical protein